MTDRNKIRDGAPNRPDTPTGQQEEHFIHIISYAKCPSTGLTTPSHRGQMQDGKNEHYMQRSVLTKNINILSTLTVDRSTEQCPHIL